MKRGSSDLNSPKKREKIQKLAEEKGITFNEARLMMIQMHKSM